MLDQLFFGRRDLVLGTIVVQDATNNVAQLGIEGDRRLVTMFGVVAVPSTLPIKNLWQYPLGGPSHMMRLCYGEGTNREDMAGMGVSAILTSPIWRVG